jgi:hypothetical protein
MPDKLAYLELTQVTIVYGVPRTNSRRGLKNSQRA